MGVFDDRKLEQMDWMSQITETIDSDLNLLLAQLPDRTLVSIEDVIDSCNSSYATLSVGSILNNLIRKVNRDITITRDEDRSIRDCFKFETTEQVEIDLEKYSMTGEIFLVKITPTLSDEILQQFMGRRGTDAAGSLRHFGTNINMDRLNEILDILGDSKEAMRGRSVKTKIGQIKSRLQHIFTTNEWRIRDMHLANKVGYWIKGYVNDGNLADLTNLCKLKVMTHSNMPIYSVKEEV